MRLTFIENTQVKGGKQYARYVCACGAITEARVAHVRQGRTRSCGCLMREIARTLVPKNPKRYATRNDYLATWRNENRQRVRGQLQAWKRRHPEKVNAERALRHARQKRATPPWVNPKAFVPFYRWARRRTKDTGVPHHVDHIVPLTNPNVCGLHVPWNLRVVTWLVNAQKGNRFNDARLWASQTEAAV